MDITTPIIRYYLNKNIKLKTSVEISEIPTSSEKLLIEKMMSVDIANMFRELGYYNKSELIMNCNSFRYVQECLKNSEHKHIMTSFCTDRYCPICSHLKSRKETEMMFKIIQAIQKDNNCKNSSLVLLTLTQRNCTGEELNETLNEMNNSIKEMLKKEFIFNKFKTYKTYKGKKKAVINKPICQGTVRHIEITSKYNKETQQIEYHPHIHILMLVKNSYFNKKRGFYWDQKKACQKWQKYMNLDYEPICDIRKVIDGADNKAAHEIKLVNMKPDGAIKEICKYSTKESDILKVFIDKNDKNKPKINWVQSKEVLSVMYRSCKNRKFLVYTGIFKKTKERLFGNKKAEDLVADIQKNEIIDIFKNKPKCKKCGSEMSEYVDRYSCKYKYYRKLKNQSIALKIEKERINELINKRKKTDVNNHENICTH